MRYTVQWKEEASFWAFPFYSQITLDSPQKSDNNEKMLLSCSDAPHGVVNCPRIVSASHPLPTSSVSESASTPPSSASSPPPSPVWAPRELSAPQLRRRKRIQKLNSPIWISVCCTVVPGVFFILYWGKTLLLWHSGPCLLAVKLDPCNIWCSD